MSDNKSYQQSLENERIPNEEELVSKIPESSGRNYYQKYYRPAYTHLAKLDDDELTTKQEVINAIPADYKPSTKWKHARKVLAAEPSFADKIVDGFPPGEILVVICSRRLGIEPDNISQANINEVQQECINYATRFRKQHADYFLKDYQERAETNLSVDRDDSWIAVDDYESVLAEMRRLVAEEYREEITSLDQGIVGSAGSANETLAAKALESAGLVENDHFENVSRKGWDLTVNYTGNHDIATISDQQSLHIEVKSTGLRERSVKGLSDADDPTILFGFFDDAQELMGKLDELMKRSLITYAHPDTIKNIRKTDNGDEIVNTVSTLNSSDYTYLRPNTRFGTDMAQFASEGDIPHQTNTDY